MTFILLLICAFSLGILWAVFLNYIVNKKKQNITNSFSNNRIYWKFTDQTAPSIDEVIKDFKLLDDWLIEFL